MQTSEQLDTRIRLAANSASAGGVLIQKMPDIGGNASELDGDASQRSQHLLNTVKPNELVQTPLQTLMYQLFWEEAHSSGDAQPLQFQCTCSREKIATMLKGLGAAEIDSILAEQGSVSVDCDYCSTAYVFTPQAASALFVNGGSERIQ